ncbi:hypothetical protein ETH_00016920 [Eimeria tenella]|uniref:Uncharacterized protein n=1 Tax=Eimeria tenella TaxID=5802 RepID=U6KT09_EIMTE|nr:hypothetical protein ETH_00016920 [Eimeria tenella]CDJ39494.1 hypothetical protein ETH_00016920 [Eimeria tenella]|eukprot:XP_013230249.1 hypothetical protein ETH_00016920 [Eimeria tenella]
MPSGTPAHHCHASPKPTVAERPQASPQMIPMTNVMPRESPFVTWDQFCSAQRLLLRLRCYLPLEQDL